MKLEWIDYEKCSNGFVAGSEPKISVCRIKHSNFKLYDDITRFTVDLKVETLEEAKSKAESVLNIHWKQVKDKLKRVEI